MNDDNNNDMNLNNIKFRSNTTTKDVIQLERIGAHSHILGLGLNELLEPIETVSTTTSSTDGQVRTSSRRNNNASTNNNNISNMIGQYAARRALGVIHKMIQTKTIGHRAILLAGPPSTGKTALAMGLACELGQSYTSLSTGGGYTSSTSKSTTTTTEQEESTSTKSSNVPFIVLSASQVYSLELSKTEVLTQAIRKSVGIKIVEETEIIEGEVVEIQIDTNLINNNTNKNSNNTSIQKVGRITLCTTDMETIYDLGIKMIEMIKQERISSGDIIRIDKDGGKITKLGRSFHHSRDYDAISNNTKFLSTPIGELQKRKIIEHVVTLHEIDVINTTSQGFLQLFSGNTGEISIEIRNQIDLKVLQWIEEGRATIIPGVLFIDEIHILDMECFSYLNRIIELDTITSPAIIIMATNRHLSTIRGTNYHNQIYGIPYDLLDRLMVINTIPYNINEIRYILQVRCNEENVNMNDDAIELLTRIAYECHSLRYAINIISLSNIIATRYKRTTVILNDIEKCYKLFVDVKRSTQLLLKSNNNTTQNTNSSNYMFNTITATTETTTTEMATISDNAVDEVNDDTIMKEEENINKTVSPLAVEVITNDDVVIPTPEDTTTVIPIVIKQEDAEEATMEIDKY